MSDASLMLTEPQRAALAKVACGCQTEGSLAVLCGPPGVGKTTVLEQLAGDGRTAAATAGSGRAICDVAGWLACPDDLPRLVLADDAHLATDAELARLLGRCQRQQPASALVLTGQGRLLTLVARDRRLSEATRIRVSLLPGSRADTATLLGSLSLAATGPARDEAVIDTVHELAAGVPAAVRRLADLASIVAASRPDGCLLPSEIEAIHRRLSPHAA